MNNTVSGIHPAPTQFTEEQIATDPILHFFHFTHLPPKLQDSSRPFCQLASYLIDTLPRNAERSVALRKLLEAKDAAVRANVATTMKSDAEILQDQWRDDIRTRLQPDPVITGTHHDEPPEFTS